MAKIETTAPMVFMWNDAEPPTDVLGLRWLDWQVDGQHVFLLRATDGWLWSNDMLTRPWRPGVSWEKAVTDRPGRYEEILWLPYSTPGDAA